MMVIFAFGINAQTKKSNDSYSDVTKTQSLVVKTASVTSTDSRLFTATAYSLRGKMANGQKVHRGAIAADPRVLPLGTVVYIEGMGTFTVKDTGGAIKGNKVDIWMSSNAMKFGKRTIRLRIISKPVRKIRV